LGAILLLAAALRLWGAAWQLPAQLHPDEAHYTWKALADMIGGDTLDPRYFRNPTLFTYVLYAQYRLLGFAPPKADEEASTADGLLRPPSGVAFVGRLNSAVLGTTTVGVVFGLARSLGGASAGLIAALFAATALILVRDSHFATNDVPSVLLLMCSILAVVRIATGGGVGAFVLAGLFGGLATSTKYNAGLFVVPLALATLAALRREDGAGRGRVVASALTAGIVALGAFLVGSPFVAITPGKFWADFGTQARFCGDPWEGQSDAAPALLHLGALVAGVGWPIAVLAVVGAVVLARRSPWAAAVVLAYPISYAAYMSRCELFFVRFALPSAPILCVLAAVGLVAMLGRLPRRLPWMKRMVAVIAIAAALPTTLDSIAHNRLLDQTDTRVLAAEWAVANVPRDAKVLIEEYTIRDFRPRAYGGPSWLLDTDIFKVTDVRPSDPTAALSGSARYFISSSFQGDRFRTSGPRPAAQRAFYDALVERGREIARFGPGPGGSSLPFEIEDLYSPFWRLGSYERPGPTIIIYELGPR
jgi:4-amino-4-deoxy-L-arabinose transferase-like glycosyltransferase